MTIGVLVFFVAFFVTLLVFASKTIEGMEDVNCAAAKFPKDIIDGDVEANFIGFDPLAVLLKDFDKELNGLLNI